MTTHDRDKVSAAIRSATDTWTEDTTFIELFYAIAHEDGRQAEREECAKYIEGQTLPDMYSEPCLAEFAKAIRARGEGK